MSLRPVLLTLLSKEPNTGYGLERLLRTQLDHLWSARLQQIYSELASLQEDGLVQSERLDNGNRPAKKMYELTEAGQASVEAWLAGPTPPAAHKDDLLVKLYCLERIPRDVIVRRLEERHSDCESEARVLRERLAGIPRGDQAQLGHLLTVESALSRAEAQASWCATALSYLREEDQASSPPRPSVVAPHAAGA